MNKHIRDMLTGFGFGKCEVKAVTLSPLKEKPNELDRLYGRLKTKESDETLYYMQEFKISCADEEYSKVLEFLRADEYRIRNIFLKDIDVTMDYYGSFDTKEVMHHLTTKEGFRMQGAIKDAERTILDVVKFTTKWCKCWNVRAFEKPLVNTGRTGYAKRILVWPKHGISPKIVV